MPSRRTLYRALLTLVSGALVVSATAGSAAAKDRWRVASGSTIVVKGHGYGHGHGMSQYGAEGAARAGLSYRKILDFYYPGTELSSASGRIRVRITAADGNVLVVRPRPGLVLRDLGKPAGEQKTVLPDNGATAWRIRVVRGSAQAGYFTRTWHRFATLTGDGGFAAGGEPVTLVSGDTATAYRGLLIRASRTGGYPPVIVNRLSMETYLRGVVAQEIPASWSPEAVQAQAVAARTYADYLRDHPQSSVYDLCDTWSCQVYGGAAAEHDGSDAAISATRHQILTADGKAAFTQFGSSSGGWTSAGSASYLPAIEDPYDDWAGNPVHDWKLTVSADRIESAWPSIGTLREIKVTGRDGNGQWGGRVDAVKLIGADGSKVASGDEFRSLLGLRSTWFTFSVKSQ